MIAFTEIQKVCDQIVGKFHPDQVILFGSYAYGEPMADSDVDLLVILPFEGKPVRKGIEMCKAIDYTFPLDLLVRTPEDTARRYRGYDPLIRHALNQGKVLYDRGAEQRRIASHR